jgi:hypothetical protein
MRLVSIRMTSLGFTVGNCRDHSSGRAIEGDHAAVDNGGRADRQQPQNIGRWLVSQVDQGLLRGRAGELGAVLDT